MRSSLVSTTGRKLVRGPSVRGDARRRRWAVIGAMAGVALVSSLMGYLTAPTAPSDLRTGPFSYFPSE